MANGFKRYSTAQITSVYNRPSDIVRLAAEWAEYVKRGDVFCKTGACPFIPGEKFDYNLEQFLYYRARAITADIANQNGDLFPHPELKIAYPTFNGKGVYFNHDSDKPEKAFGIILDSVYTPIHFGNEEFPDKYVELLCAIDRKAINSLRPGLLGDIETGKVTSTSMGTIAQSAQCSVCGNLATNMEQLCFALGTEITLHDGSVKHIEDIIVGDEVLDHQGQVQTVTHTMERETHETVYEFKITGLQYPITCTGNHPLFALRNVAGQTNRRGSVLLPPDFIHAHELVVGDFLFSPVLHYKADDTITTDEAEWLGWYASEGHIEGGDSPSAVGFSLHKDETVFAARIKELSKLIFEWDTKEYVTDNSRAVRLNRKAATEFAIKHIGRGAKDKFIGRQLRDASDEAKRAFICAYIRGDGHVSQGKLEPAHNDAKNTVVLYTASKVLAYQLKSLIESLGLRTYLHYRHNIPGPVQRSRGQTRDLDIYAIKISALDANKLSADFGKELVQPKKCNKLYAIPYAGGFVREIQGITPVPYVGKVYNFETTESHTYVAGGVAVHNCLHVHPQSPLYCKGRDVYGKKCYETNFGLNFIEDSIVYVPADGTARMLEVYASKHDVAIDRMAELFERYAVAAGKPVKRSRIELSSTFRTTGGFMPTAAPKPVPAPGQPQVSPYQTAVGEVTEEVGDATQKLFDTKIRRIIEEELRKMFGPVLEEMDKSVRPEIKTRVEQEFSKVKDEVGKVIPEVAQAPAGPAAAAEEGQAAPKAAPKAPPPSGPAPAPAPAAAAPEAEPKAAAMQYPINFVEDFSTWSDVDRQRIVQAIKAGKPYEFKGMLEFPVPVKE